MNHYMCCMTTTLFYNNYNRMKRMFVNMFSMSPTKFEDKMRTWNTILKFLLTSSEIPWLVENWRLVKTMSHEAICPCNLQCNFCQKKNCRLQLGCQTYAICFATYNEIIFYAHRVFKNVCGILIMSYCDWFRLKKLRDKVACDNTLQLVA